MKCCIIKTTTQHKTRKSSTVVDVDKNDRKAVGVERGNNSLFKTHAENSYWPEPSHRAWSRSNIDRVPGSESGSRSTWRRQKQLRNRGIYSSARHFCFSAVVCLICPLIYLESTIKAASECSPLPASRLPRGLQPSCASRQPCVSCNELSWKRARQALLQMCHRTHPYYSISWGPTKDNPPQSLSCTENPWSTQHLLSHPA